MLFMQKKERGVAAVEVVIGVSIAALVLIFATNALVLFLNAGRTASEKVKAIYLVEDGLELLRFVRDDSWNSISSLSVNATHYLQVTPSTVTVTSAPQLIDGYTRSFRISNVYRNASDDIVASTTPGSTADQSAKYVTMTVTWGTPTSTVALTSILTDIDP